MNPDDKLENDPLADDTEGVDGEHAGGRLEFLRRMAAAGLGAVVMSEEGIRKLAGQLKLPKEAMGFMLHQAEKTKDDIGRIVSEEVRKFLQSDKLREEVLKLIAGMTLEVRAEVKLVPDRLKDGTTSYTPKVSVSDLKTRTKAEKKPPKAED